MLFNIECWKSRLWMVSLLWLLSVSIHSQTTKGLVESTDVPNPSAHSGNVYALIVGVSNYPYVKPLNFAEEDALLFFEFLRSKAGGEVPENHIKLLLNEQATHANVTAGLAWLNNSLGAQPKPGDRVYIYLSGHGDAYDASEAYYLCYDSNPAGDKNNYQLGGALDIGKMKKRVATMVSKGVEVILVVDACRSGDVPGVRSGIGNPYQSVIEEPVGEVLLLSAGANQFALEDRRWGGGHGGFTWYLIKGLSGEADSDQDGIVSLIEVESYTKMKVFGDTKQMGAPQTPHFCCDNKFDCVLSKKDDVFSQRIRAEESGNTKVGLTALAARDALEKAMFEKEELKQAYFKLKKACKEQRYLGSNSAWSIWEDCKGKYTSQEIEPIRMYLMGALAAEGQKAINEEMNVSMGESPGYEYYHVRREWVEHAMQMMLSSDEIGGIGSLKDFIYALELSNSVSLVTPILDSVVYVQNDRLIRSKTVRPFEWADSLFKRLEKEYAKSAVYHYLLQSHQTNWDFYLPGAKSTNRKKEISKAMELAPSWAKPIHEAMWMNMLPEEELSELIEKRLKDDSTNFENYYLSYSHSSLQLPINRTKALNHLQRAFELHPNAELAGKLISNRFVNFAIDPNIAITAKFDSFYNPSAQEWPILKEIMDKYYQGSFHVIDGLDDSTFQVRNFIFTAAALAARLNHQKEALLWIQTENELCKSSAGLMCESIMMKYFFKDDKAAQALENEALALKTSDLVILDALGVKKENLPFEQRDWLIYRFKKMFSVLYFFNDEWVENELMELENFAPNINDGIFITSALKAILKDHVDLDRSYFQKWNEQLNAVRRVNQPELAFKLFLYGVLYYNVADSMSIFLEDSALSDYPESFPLNHVIIPLILEIPDDPSVDVLNSALLNILRERRVDTTLFLNFLGVAKANQRFKETSFIKNIRSQANTVDDKKLLLSIFLSWEDFESAEAIFGTFDWSNPKIKIPDLYLMEMITELRKCKNFSTVEMMMNTIIPYVYQSTDQDYSGAIYAINSFFTFQTKSDEALRKSPEYQRLLKKYVIE